VPNTLRRPFHMPTRQVASLLNGAALGQQSKGKAKSGESHGHVASIGTSDTYLGMK